MKRSMLTLILACVVPMIPFSAAAQERRPGSRALEQPTKMQQTKMSNTSKIATVLEPSSSPLVSFRLLFMTGSAC